MILVIFYRYDKTYDSFYIERFKPHTFCPLSKLSRFPVVSNSDWIANVLSKQRNTLSWHERPSGRP